MLPILHINVDKGRSVVLEIQDLMQIYKLYPPIPPDPGTCWCVSASAGLKLAGIRPRTCMCRTVVTCHNIMHTKAGKHTAFQTMKCTVVLKFLVDTSVLLLSRGICEEEIS